MGLDIGIVDAENEKDVKELDALRKVAQLSGSCIRNVHAIGKVDGFPVGFWEGSITSIRDFDSKYIFILGDYRNKGYGNALKEHQLKTAIEMGARAVYTTVMHENGWSLKIQEKYGAKEVSRDKDRRYFKTDLTKLNL